MEHVTPERWLWIPGFEGRYQVSDLGRVLSFARSQPRLLAGRIIFRGAYYRKVWLGNREFRVNRLVAAAFIGPCPEGREVCHKNGDSLDNWLGNLYYGTPSQNTLDRVRHGTHFNARKTVCGNCGGEYDAVSKDGRRKCRACNAQRMRRARSRI
jgi:DNA-directed RNA polymerase subunit RPC12/RpoP